MSVSAVDALEQAEFFCYYFLVWKFNVNVLEAVVADQ